MSGSLPGIPPPPAAPPAEAIADRRVWIGCSGYSYKHWRGPFYPAGLPVARQLDYYVRYFPTVELNNTFYTLPAARTFERWRDAVPSGFCFAVKASRYLTHMKRLIEPAEPLARLFERITLLGPALGPSCTSCRRAGASTPSGSPPSSTRCRRAISTRSRCGTRAG